MTDVPRDPATDRHAYSRTALARLALCHELVDLADRATAHVPTENDKWASPAETVGEALVLVNTAQEALTRAVLYERARGTSWEAIGEQLDITKQSAHERYRGAEAEWKEALQEPFHPSAPGARVRTLRLHPAAYEPTRAGRDLDQWARTRGHGDHAVTANLPTLTLAEEMNQVLAALNHLYRDMHTPPDPAARLALTERKAALLDRIAVEEGRPDAAAQADEARALAAQLRAELGAARNEQNGR